MRDEDEALDVTELPRLMTFGEQVGDALASVSVRMMPGWPTGAILLVEAGASLELVSQQLGHATTSPTEEYFGNVNTDGLARFDQAFG